MQDFGSDGGLEHFEEFDTVVGLIDFKVIKQVAYEVRLTQLIEQQAQPVEDIQGLMGDLNCHINPDKKMYGSYNVIFTVEWSDNVKWIVRIPGKGFDLDLLDLTKMDIEYNTMEYIRMNTTIPLPQVLHWETDNLMAGVPFALMTFVEGVPLYRYWYEDHAKEKVLLGILDDVAKNMAQLYQLPFDKLGMLDFSESQSKPSVRTVISNEYDRDEVSIDWGKTREQAQHTSLRGMLLYLTETLDLDQNEEGAVEILKLCVESIPEFMEPTGPFYLTIPDLDLQNIMINENGKITGFLDMDEVMTLPACSGCGRFPLWLTEDWRGLWPADSDEGDDDKEEEVQEEGEPSPALSKNPSESEAENKASSMNPPAVRVDSGGKGEVGAFKPRRGSFAKYRAHYLAAMIKEAGPKYDARITRFSPIVEAVRFSFSHNNHLESVAQKLLTYAKVSFSLRDWIAADDEHRSDILAVEVRRQFALMWTTPADEYKGKNAN